MRVRVLPCALAVVVSASACGGTNPVSADSARPSAVPTAVSCADGPQLRQRAAEDRRLREATRSDQERIVRGSRASFFASLAVVADLKCRVAPAGADEALKPAFDAARRAERTNSFYERAVHWSEAHYLATQAAQTLTQRLAAPPSK